MKSFVFRFLFVIIIVISIIVSSTLSVFAVTPTGDSIIYPFQVSGIQIVLMENGNPIGLAINADGNSLNQGRVRFTISRSDGNSFVKGKNYFLLLTMHMNQNDDSTGKYWSGEYCVSAKYRLSISSSCAITVSQDNYASRSFYGNTKITEDGSFTYNAYNVITLNYPYCDIGDGYFYYENRFYFTPNTTSSHITLNVYQVDFSAISSSERDALLIGKNIDKNTDKVIKNQDKNTDKILNAGSGVTQPDFDSTNGQLDDTTAQLGSLEGEYQIDQEQTQAALDEGNSFISGSELQLASVQVKSWIEKFTSDNPIMLGFFLSVMCLGLCFWIIGRKAAGA